VSRRGLRRTSTLRLRSTLTIRRDGRGRHLGRPGRTVFALLRVFWIITPASAPPSLHVRHGRRDYYISPERPLLQVSPASSPTHSTTPARCSAASASERQHRNRYLGDSQEGRSGASSPAHVVHDRLIDTPEYYENADGAAAHTERPGFLFLKRSFFDPVGGAHWAASTVIPATPRAAGRHGPRWAPPLPRRRAIPVLSHRGSPTSARASGSPHVQTILQHAPLRSVIRRLGFSLAGVSAARTVHWSKKNATRGRSSKRYWADRLCSIEIRDHLIDAGYGAGPARGIFPRGPCTLGAACFPSATTPAPRPYEDVFTPTMA